ncbi:MAG TPA: hypothetical protein VNM48_18090 [Chloroflexota bacterium]|nr:hypothetical protein [Chloroflexota bacterium]
MPTRSTSRIGGLARTEERIVELAASTERALMARLDNATSGSGVGQVKRKQAIANELLSAGDVATLERVRRAIPYMTDQERGQVERRITRVAPPEPAAAPVEEY